MRRAADVRRCLLLADGLRVGDAERLAVPAHLPAAGGRYAGMFTSQAARFDG